MAFDAVDILSEFVEASGSFAPSQREFDYAAFVANRRRWDTPEERARGQDKYAARKDRPMSKRAAMAYARKFNRSGLRTAKARLAALRAKRAAKRLAMAAAAFLIITCGVAYAEEPKRLEPANAVQCVCPADGAVPGETIEDRVARLEVAFRLARAELHVANLRKRTVRR